MPTAKSSRPEPAFAAGATLALVDAAEDAATTLSGIADALAWRTAAADDDLLEMLALAAERESRALRNAIS